MRKIKLLLVTLFVLNFVFLYAEMITSVIKLEGKITRVSSLPNPQKADYPDCNYTALFQVENVLSGDSIIPREMVLVIPGFRNRILVTDSRYTTGQRLSVSVELFDKIPEKLRQIQQADEITSIDLDYYYLLESEGISQLSPIVGLPGKSRINKDTLLKTIIPKVMTGQDKQAQRLRKNAIQDDLKHINELLTHNGGDFRVWYDRLSTARIEYNDHRIKKTEKWIGDSYFNASSCAYDYDETWGFDINYKEVIIQLNQYLKARNIDLIVVRVPYKSEICGDLFVPEMKNHILNPYLLKLQRDLLQADVEVIDLARVGVHNRFKYPLMYWYQNFDYHPAEGIDWTAADILSERLKRYNFTSNLQSPLTVKKVKMSDVGSNTVYRWPGGNPGFNPNEQTLFDGIYDASSSHVLEITEANNSPVLFIGDSYLGAPNFSVGASIPQYTAYQTRVIPNWLMRRAWASGICRFLVQKGDGFLKDRKVCIFAFKPTLLKEEMTGFDHLYQSGQKTLLKRLDANNRSPITFIPGISSTGTFEQDKSNLVKINLDQCEKGKAVGKMRIHLPPEYTGYPRISISFTMQNKIYFVTVINYGTARETIVFPDQKEAQSNESIFKVVKGTEDIEVTFHLLLWSGEKMPPVLLKNIEIWGVND